MLGAGLDLALACHARVAKHDAALGLPEIKLGLIPGAVGTRRLPDLIGEEPARALMLSGRALSGLEALVINEGAALLGEGIAMRAGDIDTVWLNGYGFPRWMGCDEQAV